jgi:hypothetical protein
MAKAQSPELFPGEKHRIPIADQLDKLDLSSLLRSGPTSLL